MSTESLRKRKNQSDESKKLLIRKDQVLNGRLMWKIGKCFLVSMGLAVLFVIFSVIFDNILPWKSYVPTSSALDSLSLLLRTEEYRYAVIIDAGSTGSRVLSFTFLRSTSGHTLKLHKEFFHEDKPGLSSYAQNPEQGAASIQNLINFAKQQVPKKFWNSTPLVLKATAGLRLLPNNKAENLLGKVRKVFSESGFLVTKNSVKIMSGQDEGIFSWFTINFLLDRLTRDPSQMKAVFDLGGGSTQVTFAPTEQATLAQLDTKYLVEVQTFNKKVKVYTRSYNLGLMEARWRILTSESEKGVTDLASSCVNPDLETDWTYSGITYHITGKQGEKGKKFVEGVAGRVSHNVSIADFLLCLKIAKQLVNDMDHPEELGQRQVSAISYYFDRAADAGIINPLEGGFVTVEEFHRTAKDVCEEPNAEQPFACLDLVYISSLLHNGVGLKGTHSISLQKKIDGHETSWALGAAFHVLNNGVE